VVHGHAGRREEYRPIRSALVSSAEPVAIARAFRERLGLTELYVADLDAIAGGAPALVTIAELAALGFRVWVDPGLRDGSEAEACLRAGASLVVAGLETLAGPAVLADLCRKVPGRIAFSLDLKEGRPLGDVAAWPTADAAGIAGHAIRQGVQHLISLDLARVGTGTGTGTEGLCRALASAHSEVELVAGGGVRGPDDLRRLGACGVHAVLVASALHDGRLRREDLASL
jgi:phosphoribosylformimino-5-aminoimidazole carboxamide ribotide isomerase